MMGLRDAIMQDLEKDKSIKKKKEKDIVPKSNPIKTLQMQNKLDQLFLAPKNMVEEVAFVEQMFTRGGATEERFGLHGSAIIASESEFCLRKQVLSLFYKQNTGKELPVSLLRVFEEGNAIHEKWQRLFIRGGWGSAENMDRTRFSDKYDLSFTPDAILMIDGKKWVCEIKSMNSFAFQKANDHPSARKQVSLYMHLLGIPRGFILCEDKNNQQFKVFIVDYDYDFVIPFIERLNEIQDCKRDYIKEKVLPKRKCENQGCKDAQGCYMADACFNVGMGRVKLDLKRLMGN